MRCRQRSIRYLARAVAVALLPLLGPPLAGAQPAVRIAVGAPLTGPLAKQGQEVANAVRLAADEWNARGGVLGRKIEVVEADDQGNPQVGVAAAEKVAAQMRKAVVAMGLEHRDSRLGQIVTISIGVAVVEPSPERRARGALQLADEALYQAKTMGRNRVEVLDPAAHKVLETGVFSKGTGVG